MEIPGHAGSLPACPSKAQQLFLDRQYEASMTTFLEDMDTSEEGLAMQRIDQDHLFQQGSRFIRVNVGDGMIHASVLIAKGEVIPLSLMRYLLESNFPFEYARFTLEGHSILLRFDADIAVYGLDRIHDGLRELALQAERQHYVLREKFEDLHDADAATPLPLPEWEQDIQCRYFAEWMSEALSMTATMDPLRHREGISDVLLTALLRIYGLIRPEGALRIAVKKLLEDFYSEQNAASWEEMNQQLRNGMEALAAWPVKDIRKCCYYYPRIFSEGEKFQPKQLANLVKYVKGYLPFYRENGYAHIENTSWEYPMAFLGYKYLLPQPLAAMTQLFFQINHPEYFKERHQLTGPADPSTGKLQNDRIIREIGNAWSNGPAFPFKRVRFGSLQAFNESLVCELSKIPFTAI